MLWIALAGAGCGNQAESPAPDNSMPITPVPAVRADTSPRTQVIAGPVPSQAPDSTPEWMYAPENRGEKALSCIAGDYTKNVVTVVFRAGTSQAQKESAVRSARGQVVGGTEFAGTDGRYYIKIDPGSDGEGLCRASHLLRALPYVQLVGLMDFNFG